MSNTEFADYRFTVREGAPSASGRNDAPVWIALEPMTKELDILGKGFLFLRLNPGADIQQAQDTARYLNANIAAVGYTRL